MSKQTYATFCPLFPGFYNTVFEYNGEGDDINSYNQGNGTKLNYEDFEWDYTDYYTRVGNAFVNRIENELKAFIDISFTYERVCSPKEYNFANDSIYIQVVVDLKKLIRLIKDRKAEATQYFKGKYTSRSGFISHHSNNFYDWINPKYILENPEHRVGALLDCLASIELDTDNMFYWCDSEYYVSMNPIEHVY